MKNPKFSVITVSFNHGDFIKDAIESVLAQNYDNFEHLIIDGGSTDNTIDILKSYPHLKWISEPDRGQTHALNKGFRMATGDVIAWINSDDWYAPDAFKAVAEHIVKHPIVMGDCAITDKSGKLIDTVPVLERDWMDTLKYWVYHSSPAQPAIFFSRSIIEDLFCKTSDILDESFNFAMDYDFWLTLQKRYPLNFRIDKTLAYFRTYETSKTGSQMAATYKEFSRAFRKHSAITIKPEQPLSFVLPIDSDLFQIQTYITKLEQATNSSLEIVVADYGLKPSARRDLYKGILDLGNRIQRFSIRLTPESSETRLQAINLGISDARAPIVACVPIADYINSDLIELIEATFVSDSLGLLLLNLSTQEKARLFTDRDGASFMNPQKALSYPFHLETFAIRKIAFLDSEGFKNSKTFGDIDNYCTKRLLLRLAHKAWHVAATTAMFADAQSRPNRASQAHRLYCNALIIAELVEDLERSPFARHRVHSGFGFKVSNELARHALDIVRSVPSDFKYELPLNYLEGLALSFPNFGPALFSLSSEYLNIGREQEAKNYALRWQTINEEERKSPLYGELQL